MTGNQSRHELWWIFVFAVIFSIFLAVAICRGDDLPSRAAGESPPAKLLEFYADWCGPCRTMGPAVECLLREGYCVQRVNVDRDPELTRKFGVGAVPCFIIVERGREVDRITGLATLERLRMRLQPAVKNEAKGQPHPAWRYERPEGHRAAVVRIFCQDDVRTRSIGSGVLVQWGQKVLVLTARHVVQDAKRIIVEFFTKKTHWATIVKIDPTWDCAVLELTGQPVGVEPATVELGPAAMQQDGDRLESCGYGPDGRLVSNSGLFIGYRRSRRTPDGPDDWLVISGHARGGDSGGPVFNSRGRLVGILWGTDGREVVCVQAGRVHVLLQTAFPRAWEEKAQLVPVQGWIQRRPTPPMNPPACQPDSGCCPPQDAANTAGKARTPLLPWRGEAEARDSAQSQAIDKLIELERQRLAQPPKVELPPPLPSKPAETTEEHAMNPLLAGLCALGGVLVGFIGYFAKQGS
jgi:thioredoxin 1